jgi:hypothetical protein
VTTRPEDFSLEPALAFLDAVTEAADIKDHLDAAMVHMGS